MDESVGPREGFTMARINSTELVSLCGLAVEIQRDPAVRTAFGEVVADTSRLVGSLRRFGSATHAAWLLAVGNGGQVIGLRA